MNIEELRAYCLSKAGVREDLPFDENTLVFKVMGKMFALTDLEDPKLRVNLKCPPEECLYLRETYEAVQPGYHMNKKHWITVYIDGSIPDFLIYKWIDTSYRLVVQKLPKKEQEQLKNL